MERGSQLPFWRLVAAGVVALAMWNAGVALWQRLGWWSVAPPVLILILANVVYSLRFWVRGRKGLDQWPDPHGPYYAEWLGLPDVAGDYYAWLAGRMGNREPWKTWAEWERRLGSG